MNHTKEPWYVDRFTDTEIFSESKGFVAGTDGLHVGKKQAEANADRIVACVNACAGITNEALEAGFIQECVDWGKVGKVHNSPRFRGIKIFEEDV
jgi:hypothetical protein